ncbi:MAG: response regulator [bacterium]|nr:response regulator [bacterium]
MNDPHEAASPNVPWRTLLACTTPAGALDELVCAFEGCGLRALTVEDARGAEPIADARRPGMPDGPADFAVVEVAGEPAWRLTAELSPGFAADLMPRVTVALSGWREARGTLGRADRHSAMRVRELDLVQALGRRAAEARSSTELFHAAVVTLQQGLDLDLALAAHDPGPAREMLAFLGRPIAAPSLERIARSAGEALGWRSEWPVPRRIELDTYDEARGFRPEPVPESVVTLPLMRRGRPVAGLTVVPSDVIDEDRSRLLFSAANQISLHLDRILTVREAEAGRFRSMLDSMPQAVVLADSSLRVVQANRAGERLLVEIGSLSDCDELRAPLDAVLGGSLAVCETEVQLPGGREFDVTLSPLASDHASDPGLVLVLNDVTESRKLQRHVAQSEKMSSLGQMISGVAHELNNPLASILGYAQLLAVTGKDDAQRSRLEVLQQQAERCQKIVNNLLSFARRREPERRPVVLNEVIRSVVSLMGYQLRVADVEIVTELDSSLPPVEGDLHQLQQVLVNLVTNAQHAIRSADERGKVTIRTRPDGERRALLEISDSGPGIPEEIRDKIFDPFFTTKKEGQGTGLGLSLVYGILGNHGATIDVETAPEGRGACFRVVFPVATVHAAPRVSVPEIGRFAPLAAGRILVVDDEESLANMICEVLTEDGHQAQTASNGHEALKHMGRDDFDLIISDVRMPGMGAERLYDEIRRSRPEFQERLLLTTGDTVGSEPEHLVERTGLELLHKPFDLDQLRRRVRAKLDSRPGPSTPRAGLREGS